MKKRMRILHTGVMTGKETEGELAGEIVAPKIVLWVLGKKTNNRIKALGYILHDTPVNIIDECTGPAQEKLYYVVNKKRKKNKGWVTERFVLIDG